MLFSPSDIALTADLLPFDRGCALLRGPEADGNRRRRISVLRMAAFRRAIDGTYGPSDVGLFGAAEQLLAEGPGHDPRLQGRGPGAA